MDKEAKNYLLNQFKQIKGLKNAALSPLLAPHEESVKVQILPDKNISTAKFKASRVSPGVYYAHPSTIKAMRQNLFLLGEEGFNDLKNFGTCINCQSDWDQQFWALCPQCESPLTPNAPA